METATVSSAATTASSLSPAKGLLVLGAVVFVVVAFILLTMLFGNQDAWAGFLFLTYWAGREDMKFDKLPMCAIGALFGIFMAYLLQLLPPQLGVVGIGIGIAVGVILCDLLPDHGMVSSSRERGHDVVSDGRGGSPYPEIRKLCGYRIRAHPWNRIFQRAGCCLGLIGKKQVAS